MDQLLYWYFDTELHLTSNTLRLLLEYFTVKAVSQHWSLISFMDPQVKLSHVFTRSNCSDFSWSWWTVCTTHTHKHADILIVLIAHVFRCVYLLRCFCLQTASFPWRLADCWQQIMWSDPLLFPWWCKDFIWSWRETEDISVCLNKDRNQPIREQTAVTWLWWSIDYWYIRIIRSWGAAQSIHWDSDGEVLTNSWNNQYRPIRFFCNGNVVHCYSEAVSQCANIMLAWLKGKTVWECVSWQSCDFPQINRMIRTADRPCDCCSVWSRELNSQWDVTVWATSCSWCVTAPPCGSERTKSWWEDSLQPIRIRYSARPRFKHKWI